MCVACGCKGRKFGTVFGSPYAGVPAAALDRPLGRKENGRASVMCWGVRTPRPRPLAGPLGEQRRREWRKRPHIRRGNGESPNARGSRYGSSVGRENKGEHVRALRGATRMGLHATSFRGTHEKQTQDERGDRIN
ncbi:hypothetical protein MRX96_002443 [Rhipicephalus microplus]